MFEYIKGSAFSATRLSEARVVLAVVVVLGFAVQTVPQLQRASLVALSVSTEAMIISIAAILLLIL